MKLPRFRFLERWSARTLAFTLLFSLVFVLFTPRSAYAALDWGEWLEAQKSSKYGQEKAGLNKTADTVFEMVAMIGCSPDSDCPENLQTGLIPTMGNAIASLYGNPPASGTMYALDIIDNFGVVQPAYAQTGTGFRVLSPLLPLWRAFRDFTYVLFILAFVALGFAVMFRVKISPQASITIQSALPRIVIALLLVTFSYAIAGFVVDMIYVLISIGILIFSRVGVPVSELQDQFLLGGFPQTAGAALGVVGSLRLTIGTGIAGLAGLIGGAIAFLATPALGWTLGIAIGIGVALFLLIYLLLIIYILFKLFVELLKAYIGIILAVVFGPLQIILGVIPGLPGFTQWLKMLIANALVFPAVAMVLILGRILVHNVQWSELWSAPLLGGGGFTNMLLGFGILLVAYQIPPALKKAMGAEGLGLAPGAALGTVAGPFVGFGLGAARGAAMQRFAAFVVQYARTGGFGLTPEQFQSMARGLYRNRYITDAQAQAAGILPGMRGRP